MIGINLLPEELRKKEVVKLVLPELPVKKSLIIFCAVFFGAQLLLGIFAVYQQFEIKNIDLP